MLGTLEHIDTDEIQKPAKVWKNWWRANRNYIAVDYKTREELGPRRFGQVFEGCRTYPSKDAAETVGKLITSRGHENWKTYLGAFPEGERP